MIKASSLLVYEEPIQLWQSCWHVINSITIWYVFGVFHESDNNISHIIIANQLVHVLNISEQLIS